MFKVYMCELKISNNSEVQCIYVEQQSYYKSLHGVNKVAYFLMNLRYPNPRKDTIIPIPRKRYSYGIEARSAIICAPWPATATVRIEFCTCDSG